MNEQELKRIIEAILFAADQPVNMNQLMGLFPEGETPAQDIVEQAIASLQEDYADHSLELREVSSGFRFQVRQDYASWVSKLWEEKPARYSRATLETLALIAYRQPITRAEIEEIRGVSVSTQIIKPLMERQWLKVVGHRDVPGKPALYATTKEFLDYFNLKSLEELPPLAELRDIDSINAELELGLAEQVQADEAEMVAEQVKDEAASEEPSGAATDTEEQEEQPNRVLTAEH